MLTPELASSIDNCRYGAVPDSNIEYGGGRPKLRLGATIRTSLISTYIETMGGYFIPVIAYRQAVLSLIRDSQARTGFRVGGRAIYLPYI
jgi:hypothetical protein